MTGTGVSLVGNHPPLPRQRPERCDVGGMGAASPVAHQTPGLANHLRTAYEPQADIEPGPVRLTRREMCRAPGLPASSPAPRGSAVSITFFSPRAQAHPQLPDSPCESGTRSDRTPDYRHGLLGRRVVILSQRQSHRRLLCGHDSVRFVPSDSPWPNSDSERHRRREDRHLASCEYRHAPIAAQECKTPLDSRHEVLTSPLGGSKTQD